MTQLPDHFQRIPLGQIKVDRDSRQRRLIEIDDLKGSIAKLGVINPIIVERPSADGLCRLIAGERRLAASQALGLADIIVRFSDELTPTEAQILELEENIKRSDLEWKDMVLAVQRIHGLYCSLDGGWTMGETADALSLGLSMVSMHLRVAGELRDPRLGEAGGIREAYNILTRRDQRAAGDALSELLEPPEAREPELALSAQAPVTTVINGTPVVALVPPKPKAPEAILELDFAKWAPSYSGQKFNLVHCDFPYGVGLFNGPQGRGAEPTSGYSDEDDIYWSLIEVFCSHLDKFMSVSGHLMFWCSADSRRIGRTLEIFGRKAPSLAFAKFPFIWVKSDNAGIASDPTHGPRHVYETCLFASRGKRQIVRVVSDAYSAPTDRRFHASTKPEPMLRHFMSMLVDNNTTLFDPTCGSGAALRAAESLGAKQVLGLEIDHQACEVARQVLRSARALRSASNGASK